jgi:uncharacterized membrane protein YdcZ (DUF606 family)
MGVPSQCIGSSLLAGGAIAGTIALHQHSSVPKSCIVASQVAVATIATLAVHHIDPTSAPHVACLAGSVVAVVGAGLAVSQHPHLKESVAKIPKECYLGTLGGLVLVVAGAIMLSKK